MYPILETQFLAPNICRTVVQAPRVALSAQPGQFIILRTDPNGERIPLTVCDFDSEAGTVTVVTQAVGVSSRKICALRKGDAFEDFAGPLGLPSEFMKEPVEALRGKKYLFIAGGLGTAPVYPQAKYLHAHGAEVSVILGAKTKDLVIMEAQMREVCTHLYICTDDGSYGFKGLVTDRMKALLDNGNVYDQAVAIGPLIMMKFVTLAAKPYGLPLIVSLNTLMVDGTGMCGACRVSIAGKTRFACVDGPEFDAYQVDFDEALRRQGLYRNQEAEANHKCKIDIHNE